MKYLITSSLLDSFDYLKTCPNSYQEKALDDFIAMIQRKPRPTSEACQRGIDFEDLICKNCNEMRLDDFYGVAEWYWKQKGCKDLETAVWVCEKFYESCKGGKQQVPVMKDITVGENEYHLFGYADIIHPDKIIDIKTTARYKGEDAYRNRSQHLIYSLCTGIKNFEYMVADFKGKFPVDLHVIDIEQNLEESEKFLKQRILVIESFLHNAGLWEDYVNIFTKEHKDYK